MKDAVGATLFRTSSVANDFTSERPSGKTVMILFQSVYCGERRLAWIGAMSRADVPGVWLLVESLVRQRAEDR
jgi:hypothetical protein